MVTNVYEVVEKLRRDEYVQARILHGYGGVPQDRVEALYPDAMQEAAIAVSDMSPTDPGLSDAIVKHAREWIGKQLSPPKTPCKAGPSCTPIDYPDAFMRTRSRHSQLVYSTYRRRGMTAASMECGISPGAVRIELYRIRIAFELWSMRIPYDPVVEKNLRKSRTLWGDIYVMHIRDCMTAGQIAKDLGVRQQDVSNVLRTVRARMPYGGLRPPKGAVRLRFRAPRAPRSRSITA